MKPVFNFESSLIELYCIWKKVQFLWARLLVSYQIGNYRQDKIVKKIYNGDIQWVVKEHNFFYSLTKSTFR